MTIGNPPAPPIMDEDGPAEGRGLCEATAVSLTPNAHFGSLDAGSYANGVNTFMEAHQNDRTERVVRTVLDFSNNNTSGQRASFGDFVDAMLPECTAGGCDFALGNDSTTSFAARLRGFLNVPPDLVEIPLHIGIFADDAASLSLFDKTGRSVTLLVQPPVLGAATWRMSETVTFTEAGLYPVEVLYVEITDHAALEISHFAGEFADFQRSFNQDPVVSLAGAGFSLFAPDAFVRSLSGAPHSAADPDTCRQCPRDQVGQFGDCNSDAGGRYCNEAALCAPCDTPQFCGPQCITCGAAAPFCGARGGTWQCVECRDSSDCPAGRLCDPDTSTCRECLADADCDRGRACVDHACVPCTADNACAGNSCNCCPEGPSGRPMECAQVPGEPGAWACTECFQDTDCATGVCDVVTGHCVDRLVESARSDCCGEFCEPCPDDFPFCLPGPFGSACAQCRRDTDCAAGHFCLSGQCMPCTTDRRCGVRCTSCAGIAPYCRGQTPDDATCVGCMNDSQCGGGTCDPVTGTCAAADCPMSCPDSAPHCHGGACVQCFADTQCPCNGTCDPATLTCTASCANNADCLGNQHCRWDEAGVFKECALGPMPAGATCGSTMACAVSVGRGVPFSGLAVFFLSLSWWAFAGLPRARRRRPGHVAPRTDRAQNRP